MRILPRKYIATGLITILLGLSGYSSRVLAQNDYKLGVQAYQAKLYEEARDYWENSAADGNLSAAFNLGLLLSKGIGGDIDTERAVSLFRRVAESGLAIGEHNLALAYYSGNGIEQNMQQARIWWERAARQGHTQAQFNLGAMLWNGEGVEKDSNAAVKWFRKASDSGNLQARAFLDSILKQADTLSPAEPLDTPASDADPVINTLLQQAAAAYNRQNFDTAFVHWQKAAELNNAIAQYQLGRLYLNGLGTEKDLSRAYQTILLSAQQGLAQAQYRVARYYLEGEQVNKNDTLALFWMQSAADQSHVQAKDYLEGLR
jgi:TPR repeat protein